jgi:hypothetical protein
MQKATVFLLGGTYHGKSLLANCLSEKDEFKISDGGVDTACTTQLQECKFNYKDAEVTLIDLPGMLIKMPERKIPTNIPLILGLMEMKKKYQDISCVLIVHKNGEAIEKESLDYFNSFLHIDNKQCAIVHTNVGMSKEAIETRIRTKKDIIKISTDVSSAISSILNLSENLPIFQIDTKLTELTEETKNITENSRKNILDYVITCESKSFIMDKIPLPTEIVQYYKELRYNRTTFCSDRIDYFDKRTREITNFRELAVKLKIIEKENEKKLLEIVDMEYATAKNCLKIFKEYIKFNDIAHLESVCAEDLRYFLENNKMKPLNKHDSLLEEYNNKK